MKFKITSLLGVVFFAMQFSFAQKSISEKPYVPGELIVRLVENGNIQNIVRNAPDNMELEVNEALSKSINIWLLEFNENNFSHLQMKDYLEKQRLVELVQNNHYIEMRSTIPDDTDFSSQWHHNNTGQTGGTSDADIDSDLAWDITTGGQTAYNDDIVVCLIESGNLDHNDITGNRWFNSGEIEDNGIDDDGNGYIDDYHGWNPINNNDDYGTGGHGTNCLGMMGAVGNNNLLVTGANWNVKLMVVGDFSISTEANAIEAYTYPYDMRSLWNSSGGTEGAFVVATSSSWGIDGANPADYPVWCDFYNTLGEAGILNVGATTNSEFDVDTGGDMPTACSSPYMVGVGRTDHNDNTAGGYGDETINFGAPGIDVVTTANTNTTTTTTGTSFACPLTAGVIGLAYSIPCASFMDIVNSNPQQGADLVLQALMDGVDPKAQLADRFVSGGRLNSHNTLNELMTVTCSGDLCLAPGSISTGSITDSTAEITFTPYSESTSTFLFWREVGAATWNADSTATSPYSLTGLTGCTEYEYYLQSECGEDTLSNESSTYTFTTTGCGACIDLAYCNSSGGDASFEWIEAYTIAALNNVSGSDGGYGDFTNDGSTALTIGDTYPFTIDVEWAGTLYDEYSKIWIDLDQSGTFEAGELVFDQGASSQADVTGDITIPVGATPGSTRMRVQMAWDDGNPLPGVCDNFGYGEVEDYCVTLEEAQICNMTTSETIVQPECAGQDNGSVDVAVSGGTPGYTYAWSTGETTAMASNLAEDNYELTITDATGCDTTITYSLTYNTVIDGIIDTTNVSCYGGSDGTAEAIASGGTSYSYAWSNGETTALITDLVAGTYDVTITDDATMCSTVITTTLSEPAPIQASFSYTDNFLEVTFTNTSTSGTYSWDFGDGNSSPDENPVHLYDTDGTYNVCLTVTTACGDTTSCQSITVAGDDSSIDEVFGENLKVYPNPASISITFEIPNYDAFSKIEIVDVLGKVVAVEGIQGLNTKVGLRNVENGTYFYKLISTSGQVKATNKIIVAD